MINWEDKDLLFLIEGWARDGFSNNDIALKLNITRDYFQKILVRKPHVKEVVDKGRYIANLIVENALFKKANGYTTEIIETDSNGYTKKIIKEEPADNRSIEIWLKTKKPEIWNKDDDANKNLLAKVEKALEIIPGNI